MSQLQKQVNQQQNQMSDYYSMSGTSKKNGQTSSAKNLNARQLDYVPLKPESAKPTSGILPAATPTGLRVKKVKKRVVPINNDNNPPAKESSSMSPVGKRQLKMPAGQLKKI